MRTSGFRACGPSTTRREKIAQTLARKHGTAAVLLLLLLAMTVDGQQSSTHAEHAVNVQMQNITYHFTDKIGVHIRFLRGQLIPAKGEPPVFDDKNSFGLKISSAEIAITPASLANVLNSYVFAKSDAPLKAISIEVARDRLKIKGKLHSKGDIPFETEGVLSASEDGKIRFHAVKVKALHLPVKRFMDLFGIEIADLIKTGKVQGVTAEKDDLILDAAKLLPPPHIIGQITAVRLDDNNIIQTFGYSTSASARMHVPFANYMAYSGNQLRFGKLLMSETDMVLIDMDPSDPFDFYIDHYVDQLVGGYTKETRSFGLRVFMRDYDKLRHKSVGLAATSKH